MEHNSLIISRLGENLKKKEFISRNIEKKQKKIYSFHINRYAITYIAACITTIIVISTLMFNNSSPCSSISISEPSFTEFRGGGFEKIESLIKENKYDKALPLVDIELNYIKEEIKYFTSADMSEEEKKYIHELYNNEIEELLWCKIFLLVKLEKVEILELCCNEYIKNCQFQTHRKEVEHIIKIIK